MKLNFYKMHETELAHITGCSYAVLLNLLKLLDGHRSSKLGRPRKHGNYIQLILTMFKLRHNLDYRLIEQLTGIDSVTASRAVSRVLSILSNVNLTRHGNLREHNYLITDSTTIRVNSSNPSHYSGYKHHKGLKVQAITDNNGFIVDIADAEPASMHDKTLWNLNYNRVLNKLDKPLLADKAYAGAVGENSILFRPSKLNEKLNKNLDIRFGNAEMSKIRVKVEHIFGKLKVFKMVRYVFNLNLSKLTESFKVIALAHNLAKSVY